MNTEFANYLAACRNPFFAASAASRFLQRASSSVLSRILPRGHRFFYPDTVKRLQKELLSRPSPDVPAVPWKDLPSCSLTLTGAALEVRAEPDWFARFSDEEITLSLHRWNWLLRGLTDDATPLRREQGLNLMRSWINRCHAAPPFGEDAYTTGERIVNGSLFLLLTGSADIPPDFSAAVNGMARAVAAHLEYHGAGLTGNHAFNNARALFFAGAVAKCSSTTDLAFAIASERLPVVVTTEGFLREGSSHYHFLFTRWVLEMLWLARREGHQRFIELLAPYADLLVRRCWFFLVRDESTGNWHIPLIGDVSPDFPPDWLLSLPWSASACAAFVPDHLPLPPQKPGWSDLFGLAKSGAEGGEPKPAGSPSLFSQSGWFRIDAQAWTVFIRAESTDGRLQAGHKHQDLGSFVLFRRGAPLLVDTGRLDYTLSALSCYGKSAYAHNTVLVDGLGPAADSPAWFAGRYSAVVVNVDVSTQENETVVVLAHSGFDRLAFNRIGHKRRFKMGAAVFRVEDEFDGDGAHEIQTRFHFAPGLPVREDSPHAWLLGESGIVFESHGRHTAERQCVRTEPPFGGLFFPVYGGQQACETLDLSERVTFPSVLRHALTVAEN